MGIISKLKAVLGGEDPGTPVSVEREPEAQSERAVKGLDGERDHRLPDDQLASEAPTEGGADAAGEPVDSIKGIGPAYADQLAAAGIETVADLAAADADAIAAETDLGAGRVAGWIERAKARSE